MNATLTESPRTAIIASLLRASALPLAFKCPGSIRQTEVRINESNVAADTGSAGHFMARQLPIDGKIDWSIVDMVADEYGCDSNELRFLCSRAQQLWNYGKVANDNGELIPLKDCFPCALTEVSVEYTLDFEGLTITGTLDGISISGDIARAYDWKFGRLDSDYYHQMMAYASMVLLAFPVLREMTITILWVRDNDIENYTVTREQAQTWMKRVENEVVNWDGVLRPHEKCVHCPRFYECPAANALARSAAAAILNINIGELETQLSAMNGQQKIDLKHQAKMVRQLAEKAEEAIKNLLMHGEEIVGNDTQLVLGNEPTRQLDAVKTWPLVEEIGFDQDDWAHVCKIGISKLEKRVAQKAGHGNGAGAVRKLKERLEHAGAIELVDKFIVKERRIG